MNVAHVNLLFIPINAYLVGTSESDWSKGLNAFAVLINLMTVAVKLSA